MIDVFIPGRWYAIGSRAYQVLAIEDGRLLVRFHGETTTTRLTISGQAMLAEPVDGPPVEPPSPAPRHTAFRPSDETSTFQLKETTPIVVELIRKHGRATTDFLTHDDIVRLILNDPKGRHLVDEAIRLGNPDPPAKIAGNMLDFLSKNITEGKSEYATLLQRKKVGGKWGYRPR